MKSEALTKTHIHIVLSDDELYNLMLLVATSPHASVFDVASLIKFHVEYLSEHAFLTVKEPNTDGN